MRKQEKPKGMSIAMSIMRDVQGSASMKLAMFQRVRTSRGFAKEDPAELAEAEEMLRNFAAIEKDGRNR